MKVYAIRVIRRNTIVYAEIGEHCNVEKADKEYSIITNSDGMQFRMANYLIDKFFGQIVESPYSRTK